jgi:hypothetical protein
MKGVSSVVLSGFLLRMDVDLLSGANIFSTPVKKRPAVPAMGSVRARLENLNVSGTELRFAEHGLGGPL